MVEWLALIPMVLLLFLGWTVCGFAMLASVGVRQAKWYLASPVAASCFFGIVSLLSAALGWSLLLLGGCLAVALCVRVLLSGLLERHAGIPSPWDTARHAWDDVRHLQPAKACWACATIVGTAVAVFVLVARSCGSVDLVLQGYDMPFHLSVVRHIVDTANASPIGAGSVMGTPTAIYPDLWHANVALVALTFGLTIPQGAWIVLLAITMLVLPCSVVLLVDVLFDEVRGPSFCLAGVLAVCGTSSPLYFLAFGPVLSNLYGLIMLPAAIAFACAEGKLRIPRASRWACNLMMFGALCFAHPNVGMTYLVLMLPSLVANAAGPARKVALACAYGAGWVLCMRSPLFARTVNCQDRVKAGVLAGQNFCAELHLDYEALSPHRWLPILVTLFVVGVAVAAAAATRKRWRRSWFLVSVSIIMAQVICSMFPENGFSKAFTGFWYRDYDRLDTIFGFLLAFVIGAIPELVVRRMARCASLSGRARVTVASLIVAACGLWSLMVAVEGARARGMELNDQTVSAYCLGAPTMLNDRYSKFCERVKEVVGDSGVLNSDNDASVWMYPMFGINAQLKGRCANQVSPMDDELYTLIRLVDAYGTDTSEGEAARHAARSLGVQYVVRMSGAPIVTTKFKPDGTIDYQAADAITRVDDHTPGFEPVLEEDGMRLWRLAHPE